MKSLIELCKSIGALKKNQRVYEVTCGTEKTYVVSNSPGQAAQEVCEVRTVSQKELMLAALEAAKEQG